MYIKASIILIKLIKEGNGKMGARMLAKIHTRKGKTQKGSQIAIGKTYWLVIILLYRVYWQFGQANSEWWLNFWLKVPRFKTGQRPQNNYFTTFNLRLFLMTSEDYFTTHSCAFISLISVWRHL